MRAVLNTSIQYLRVALEGVTKNLQNCDGVYMDRIKIVIIELESRPGQKLIAESCADLVSPTSRSNYVCDESDDVIML